MNKDEQKKQKDPAQKDIKFILNLLNSNKFAEAKKEAENQIINFPASSILFNILGAIFAGQNQLKEAIENYKKAIKLNSEYAQAYNNLGIAFHKSDNLKEAINYYKKAIGLKNDFAEAFNNLGNALRDQNRQKDAIEYYKKALQLKSNYAEAFNNLATSYQELGEYSIAIENFRKALKIKSDYAEVYNKLGLIFNTLAKFNDSLFNFNEAIRLNPRNEKYYNNKANVLNDLGRYDDASTEYEKAIKIKPDYAAAYSNLLFNLNYKIKFEPDVYLSVAKKFRLNCKTITEKINYKYKYKKNPKRLVLGFVSADFGNHPGGFFSLNTLRELKNKNFDLIAFSTANRNDGYSHHFKNLFSKWHLVEKEKDEKIISQIFDDRIHILFDLQGHSAQNRLPIFIYKAAPVQISWLGQGSTGINEIDYFVGSPHITPPEEEKYYVEKVVRLPKISQCFTPPDFELEVSILPAIKNKFITFGCINKLSKINDDVVKLWTKILLSSSNSKLLLKNKNLDDTSIAESFYRKFEKLNIARERLIFVGESKTREELLSTYNQIDIALDPFPFQGNTSTCEAVWMGVPVITLIGDRYLFHFGESIISNLNMKEWIAKNKEEYVSKALEFSSDIGKLAKIRSNLRQAALQSPVFDSKAFGEDFSKMIWKIWEKFENSN